MLRSFYFSFLISLLSLLFFNSPSSLSPFPPPSSVRSPAGDAALNEHFAATPRSTRQRLPRLWLLSCWPAWCRARNRVRGFASCCCTKLSPASSGERMLWAQGTCPQWLTGPCCCPAQQHSAQHLAELWAELEEPGATSPWLGGPPGRGRGRARCRAQCLGCCHYSSAVFSVPCAREARYEAPVNTSYCRYRKKH